MSDDWDNPFTKRRVAKHELAHRKAVHAARIKSASVADDPVSRAVIIKRDQARCWICKAKVGSSLIELDHVVPISRGGKHVPSNVRVACRSCNAWHGDRLVTPLG